MEQSNRQEREMLVLIRLATKASAEVRDRDNKLYVILIPNLMINGRTNRRIGIKEAYCKLVQLQLKYEISAVEAIIYRTHRRNVYLGTRGN